MLIWQPLLFLFSLSQLVGINAARGATTLPKIEVVRYVVAPLAGARLATARLVLSIPIHKHFLKACSMHVLWTVQRIVRTEWYDFAIGQNIVDAAFFGRTHIKVPGIHKG